MLSIRRVLFPTDFSDGALRAFPQAVYLANWHDAELHIVHVTVPSGGPNKTLPVSQGTLGQWLKTSGVERKKSSWADLDRLTIVQKRIESGVPAEQLVGYVDDEDIDLVVMGTHGRRGLRRTMLGSVTEEVVRKASCPVLTVRTEAAEAPGRTVRRILVPIDFSAASETAVQYANEIAQTYGAELHLLHVVEEVVYPAPYGVEPARLPTQEIVSRVEKTLGDMAREGIGYEHVQISATVGYAPSTILDYVEENDVDLIVIATHGRTGLDRMLLGSVAERVIRRSSAPVFVVKPEAKSLLPVGPVGATDEA